MLLFFFLKKINNTATALRDVTKWVFSINLNGGVYHVVNSYLKCGTTIF